MTKEEKEIGERIKYLREVNNYTRDALAERIGISAKFLYEIEKGRKGFSADTLVKIARSVSVSCDYIMLGDNEQNKVISDIEKIMEEFSIEQLEQLREILEMVIKGKA